MIKTSYRSLALGLSLLVTSSALAPLPAIASESGRRNTTYALGALTAVLAYKKQWVPAAIAAAGTYAAYHNYQAAVNARHRRERALAYQYRSYPSSGSSYGSGYSSNNGSSYHHTYHHSYSHRSYVSSSSSSDNGHWARLHAQHLARLHAQNVAHQQALALQAANTPSPAPAISSQTDELARTEAQLKAQQAELAAEQAQLRQAQAQLQSVQSQPRIAQTEPVAQTNNGGISKAAVAIPSALALLAAIGGGLLLFRRGVH